MYFSEVQEDYTDLISILLLVRLLAALDLLEHMYKLVKQNFIRENTGYRCKLCGRIVEHEVMLILHLFREHPERYYDIEERVLSLLRAKFDGNKDVTRTQIGSESSAISEKAAHHLSED